MQRFTPKEMKQLIAVEDKWCLSLYMPADPVAASADTNRIRFKTLLGQAESMIEPVFDSKKTGRSIIAAGKKLLADENFWRYQSEGLAVFMAPDTFYHYRLPLRLAEEVRMAGRFFVKPLIPLLMNESRFYLPALNKKVSEYPHIMTQGITGNPEERRSAQPLRTASDIVSEELEKNWRESHKQYKALAGNGYTAAGVYQVLPSAAYGRIQDLFVSLDDDCAGIFNREKNELWLTENREDIPVIEDMLNLAVVETMRHGGNVYALDKNHMPERDTGLAAILRH